MLRELHLHKSGVAFQPDEADHEGKHLDDAVAVHYGGAEEAAAAVVVATPANDAPLRGSQTGSPRGSRSHVVIGAGAEGGDVS